ncbi:hypothetical protein EDD37DRAFT_451074 [Exophiala viscosa]|uniref:uncharacterized protein n=1 Tax=Exophiala viscosa TaxID=2486360 RepID=UPI00218C9434|nr:hypothetical protein EDD37DRAFT_451074 [Exophiala viscosa]
MELQLLTMLKIVTLLLMFGVSWMLRLVLIRLWHRGDVKSVNLYGDEIGALGHRMSHHICTCCSRHSQTPAVRRKEHPLPMQLPLANCGCPKKLLIPGFRFPSSPLAAASSPLILLSPETFAQRTKLCQSAVGTALNFGSGRLLSMALNGLSQRFSLRERGTSPHSDIVDLDFSVAGEPSGE